ncbi:hypothetical protein [Nocardia higoensis]|uniref:hypothetical protein n=1 Tax=Nocardia higoensis TaxID=228599 RepID=UPI0003011D2C|nr:hypothetical protein [Nocardia higoensis]
MSRHRIRVTVHGDGAVADRIAERVDARADLTLVARTTGTEQPPTGTDCVVYAPGAEETAADAPKTAVPQLLRAGYDVVTTLPLDERLPETDILDACRAGSSTFHASAGFQSAVAIRMARTLAEVTRDIRRVELIEEVRFPDAGVYPWGSLAGTGLGAADSDAAVAAVQAVHRFYEAGLHTLDEAVFGGSSAAETPATAVDVEIGDAGLVERVGVHRDLGTQVGYHSIWTKAEPEGVPLRYRLVTTTDAASGTATVEFRFAGGLHPGDHLTGVGVLDALRAVFESEPGITRRDLAINYLKSDDRLKR